MTSIIGVTFGSAFTAPMPPPADIDIVYLRRGRWDYCEIGALPPAAVLNSRVKRDRPNSPDTPLMR